MIQFLYNKDFEVDMKKLKNLVIFFIFLVISASIFAAFKGEIVRDYDILDSASDILDLDHESEIEIASENKDWNLILVNKNNPIPENYSFNKSQIYNDILVDDRILSDLRDMLEKMEEDGFSPEVTSGYRTNETQTRYYQNKVDDLIAQGIDEEEAKKEASKNIAIPGTSEHEVGLDVDINEKEVEWTTEKFYKWLENNSYKYGFILRYPYGKTDITGIKYEPWHYRYVGKDHAPIMYQEGLTLEEYLDK